MEQHTTVDTMSIGFFLPSFNNLPELIQAIQSILPHSIPFVVGVDGSTDGTVEWLEKNQYPYLHHPNFENRGRAATRNLALRLEWDWIIFMDSDLEFIGELHTLKNDPSNVHIHVGTVTYSNQNTNIWLDYCAHRGVNKFTAGPISFESFTTGICAISRVLFQYTQGFDEKFTEYGGEDLEFAIRAKNNHTPFFKSNELKALSRENKNLEFALQQLKVFGNSGLKLIRKKHPHLFLYGIQRPIPLFLEGISKKILNSVPKKIRRILIHYLVYCAVKKGYYSKRN